MKLNKSLVSLMTLASLSISASAYNIVERARLIDDKFKTLNMTKDYGHDFFINIDAALTPELQDLADDAEDLGDIDSSNMTTAVAEVNSKLGKYYNKEQVIRGGAEFGIPLPSFSISNFDIKPNLRFGANLMAVMTPKTEKTTMTEVFREIEGIDGVPSGIVDKFLACIAGYGAGQDGDDLFTACVPGSITQAEVDQIKDATGLTKLPYYHAIKTTALDTPVVDIYAKGEAKAGLFFDYKDDKHWFGKFGLYALGRADINKKASAVLLLAGGSEFEFEENTVVNMAIDYRLGYRNSNYSVFAAVEELKLAEMSSEDTGATPDFGNSALLRLHAQADYQLSIFKMKPYFGSHARSGYGFGDGFYLGADWGLFVWGDRLGLNFKTQMDKEYFTLGARAKIWLLHIDLTSKVPVASEVDGNKLGEYYGANIRLFF